MIKLFQRYRFLKARNRLRPDSCHGLQFSGAARRTISALTVAILLGSGVVSTHAQTRVDYDKIVVFGDSFSDNGNMAAIDTAFGEMTNERPYNEGRVSNGLLTVEYLAAALDLEIEPDAEKGLNFALAGARAVKRGPASVQQLRLSRQVDAYEEDNDPEENNLFVITVGLNDVIDTQFGSVAEIDLNIENAVKSINGALNRLINLGAQHFIVVNLPNIAYLPRTVRLAALEDDEDDRAALLEVAEAQSRIFNEQLTERLTATVTAHNKVKPFTTADDAELTIFDLFDLSERLRADPVDYGFNKRRVSCFTHDADSQVVFTANCDTEDENINRFVYFDPRHPTDAYHRLIADEIYALLEVPDTQDCEPNCPPPPTPPPPPCNTTEETRCVDDSIPLFNRWAAKRMIEQNPHPSANTSGSASTTGESGGSNTGSSSQTVTINGVPGVVRRASPPVYADEVRSNPMFDSNYVSESGQYSGPLWYPL